MMKQRKHKLTVWLSAEEHKMLESRAKAMGRTLSQQVREAIRDAASIRGWAPLSEIPVGRPVRGDGTR